MGMKRRDFAILGAAALAGLAASPAPWKLARDLTRQSQDPSWLPEVPDGELVPVNTVIPGCPCGAGVTVFTRDGQPVYARGNPDHPLSLGRISIASLAAPRARHMPGRLRSPLVRKADGNFEAVSLGQAMELLAAKVGEAGTNLMMIGPSRPGALDGLIGRFAAVRGSGAFHSMPCEARTATAALAAMGVAAQPGYDFDNAPGVVLMGADAFGSMPAAPHFSAAASRLPREALVALGPARGATAALCGTWLPLPAGREACLAMGIAWHLDALGRVTGTAPDLAEFLALVRGRFWPGEVERASGLKPEIVRSLAVRIADGALAVPGSPSGEGAGLAPFVAAFALAVLTGRVNVPGGLWLTGPFDAGPGQAPTGPLDAGRGQPLPDLPGALGEIALGRAASPGALLIVEADPTGELPDRDLTARGIGKAPFKAVFTPVMTATARLCDLVLPTPMPLERHEDVPTPYGLAFGCLGVARPVVPAAAGARHPGDALIDLAARLGTPLGPSSFKQALKERAAALEGAGGYVARGVMPWSVLAGQARPAPEADLFAALEQGRLFVRAQAARAGRLSVPPQSLSALPASAMSSGSSGASAVVSPAGSGGLSLAAGFLARALAPVVQDISRPFTLVCEPARMDATSHALLGDIPDPGAPSTRTDETSLPASGQVGPATPPARLNAATARAARIKGGVRINISSTAGSMEAVAVIDESVMDGHVFAPGGAPGTRLVLAASPEPGSGLSVWNGCRIKLERA
jgi:anaerobic selenocysteine-containing dehydrogenase